MFWTWFTSASTRVVLRRRGRVANSVSSMTWSERSPSEGDFGKRRLRLNGNQYKDWLRRRLRLRQQKTIRAIVFAMVSEKETYGQRSGKVRRCGVKRTLATSCWSVANCESSLSSRIRYVLSSDCNVELLSTNGGLMLRDLKCKSRRAWLSRFQGKVTKGQVCMWTVECA